MVPDPERRAAILELLAKGAMVRASALPRKSSGAIADTGNPAPCLSRVPPFQGTDGE
jgi:hypothetical protein